MVLERRTYPLLAVVLSAMFVLVSVCWMSGRLPGPQHCLPDNLQFGHSALQFGHSALQFGHSALQFGHTARRDSKMSLSTYLLLHSSNASNDPYPYNLSLLSPLDRTYLIDLHNFTFLMNDPVCNSSSPPLFVVIVHSAPFNDDYRRDIRSNWGQGVHLVFLVGETNSTESQLALTRENDDHHDLVQGSFLDSYRNLTYKHVMGLKWVTYYCPGAKYIVKTDDDVFVNTPFLKKFLTQKLPALGVRRLVLCNVFQNNKPDRSPEGKYRVSFSEYKGDVYPDYCLGWAILYSPDAVFMLYREAQRSEYFWIDDIHVTGTLLSRVNLTLTSLGSLSVGARRLYNRMKKRRAPQDFLFCLIPTFYHLHLWKYVNSPSRTG